MHIHDAMQMHIWEFELWLAFFNIQQKDQKAAEKKSQRGKNRLRGGGARPQTMG